MLTVGGTALADVDGHIEHGSLHAAHQFGLCEGRPLEVQSAHHAIRRLALVVLHKDDAPHLFVELSLRETLEEIASWVDEDARFDDEQAVDLGFYYVHICEGGAKPLPYFVLTCMLLSNTPVACLQILILQILSINPQVY